MLLSIRVPRALSYFSMENQDHSQHCGEHVMEPATKDNDKNTFSQTKVTRWSDA